MGMGMSKPNTLANYVDPLDALQEQNARQRHFLPMTRPLQIGDIVQVQTQSGLILHEQRVIDLLDDLLFVCENNRVYHRKDIYRIVLRVTKTEMKFAENNPFNTTPTQRERLKQVRDKKSKSTFSRERTGS